MSYEEFIQQYVIHNHGGEYEDDDKLIWTAIRVANNLVNRGFLKHNNNNDND